MEVWTVILHENGCEVTNREATISKLYNRTDLDFASPSRHDGMSLEEETCLRRSYCQLLLEAGKRLKM